MLSRAARGEGIICPKCKTFAPLGAGGEFRCPQCGGVIAHEALGEQQARPRTKPVKSGPPVPSGHLGTDRS